MSQRIAAAVVGAAVGAGATAKEEWLAPFISLGKATLGALAAKTAADATASADSAQIAALSASVKTLSAAVESALKAQSGYSASTLLLVGAPLVGAFYYLKGLGWVTPAELKEQLQGVQEAVVRKLVELKEQLFARIGVLEAQAEKSAVWQEEVRGPFCCPRSRSLLRPSRARKVAAPGDVPPACVLGEAAPASPLCPRPRPAPPRLSRARPALTPHALAAAICCHGRAAHGGTGRARQGGAGGEAA